MIRWPIIVLALLLPLNTASAEEAWNGVLREQLQSQQSCKLNFITALRELDVGGRKAVEGRAHCEDGRTFDFSGEADSSEFKLRQCGPQVC